MFGRIGRRLAPGQEPQRHRADTQRLVSVQPARLCSPVLPERAIAARQIHAEQPPIDQLQIRVPVTDLFVVDRDVGLGVATDNGERLMNHAADDFLPGRDLRFPVRAARRRRTPLGTGRWRICSRRPHGRESNDGPAGTRRRSAISAGRRPRFSGKCSQFSPPPKCNRQFPSPRIILRRRHNQAPGCLKQPGALSTNENGPRRFRQKAKAGAAGVSTRHQSPKMPVAYQVPLPPRATS